MAEVPEDLTDSQRLQRTVDGLVGELKQVREYLAVLCVLVAIPGLVLILMATGVW